MNTTSPLRAAADVNKPCRGRPPLLAKAARNSRSIDRFLLPGNSSSTSASSASAMAGQEPGACENQDPNVVLCSSPKPSPKRTASMDAKCSPESEKFESGAVFSARPVNFTPSASVSAGGELAASENQNSNVISGPDFVGPKKPSRGRPRKNPSTSTEATMPAAANPHVEPPFSDRVAEVTANAASVSAGGVSAASENQNPNLVSSSDSVAPKKAPRGRPRKSPSMSTEAVIPAANPYVESHSIDRVAEVTAKAAPKMSTKGVKRKRIILRGPLDAESKDSLAKELSSELSSLLKFYREDEKVDLTEARTSNAGRRAEVAFLLEESGLPFSSLVANILLQLKAKDDSQGGSDLSLTSLRSMVLSVGERISFGTSNPDADVLEDDSDDCLWCWEVRDIKLFPEAYRSMIAARRRKRRKISERIAALSGMITVLKTTCCKDQEQSVLEKAEEALLKTDTEELIRAHFSELQSKMTAKGSIKEEKVKDKEALKEQYRRARETEKERKRMEKEEEKEKKRIEKEEEKKKILLEKEKERLEKERERIEKEASKQRSKEALRQEKEMKKQQDEIEKEQKRKEKEEADLKKQSALKKQANLMDRFLHSKEQEPLSCLPNDSRAASPSCDATSLHEKVIHDMDIEMALCADKSIQDLLGSHITAWKNHSLLPSRRNLRRWGQRRVPKMAAVNELRLQGGPSHAFGGDDSQAGLRASAGGGLKRSRSEFEEIEGNAEKCDADWDDSGVVDYSALVEQDVAEESLRTLRFHNKRRKLLQFDKSHRPAYYGSFSKKSDVVRPRNPLKMDSNLDYENDSDEEWEEEDPGESLSDCEKDEEDEKVDPDEDEEAGDGFVVPDGYLSESEVAHVDESDSESDTELSQFSPSRKVAGDSVAQHDGNQNLLKFARQCKVLEQLTNQALQHNRPYIICNFHRNRLSTSVQKTDRICLEALKMCCLSKEIQIEVPQDPLMQEKLDDNKKPIHRPKRTLPETALREMVEIIMSSTHGLKRLVDLLSTKFPAASRSQLRAKIKEVADYADNHWQVKKEVLEQLGITVPFAQVASTSDPVSKIPCIQVKPITKFFSKRCLPPETAGMADTSPIKAKENCCANSTVAANDVNILRSEARSMTLEGNPYN